MIWLSAGLLAVALQQSPIEVEAPDFPAGTLELKPDTFVEPPFAIPTGNDFRFNPDPAVYSFDNTVDVGLWTAPMTIAAVSAGKMTAVFGFKPRAAGVFDDMDYRCGLVISRDGKNGWLVDRLENTAVRWEGSTLPEWCSE